MLPIQEITLAQFFDQLDVHQKRIPVEGILETTFRCNLGCVHCYVNQPAGSAEERSREVPLPRLKALVDEMAEAGCVNLLLTGGEVLVRPDFAELYLHALSRGLLVTVFTNGTLVTERIADLFDRHRPLLVEISLYGMTRETYERITGVPGSYDRCLEGIRRLAARGVPLKLKTMLMSWNRDELPAMRRFAQELGVGFKHDGLLNPRVDCGASRYGEVQIPPAELVALEMEEPETRARLEASAEDARALAGAEWEDPYVYSCGAGQVAFTLDPYGRLQMCQLSRRAAFDLQQESFAEVWGRRFPELRARPWQTNAVCQRCNLTPLCGSCPGAAEMETGDIEAVVPQFCRIAHGRAFALLGESCGHREDASCCLGGAPGEAPPPQPAAHGCGGCGHAAPPPALLQITRRDGGRLS
ncbi:MAG TPA: radical SAM protein [Vicinamibacteria bacterium]